MANFNSYVSLPEGINLGIHEGNPQLYGKNNPNVPNHQPVSVCLKIGYLQKNGVSYDSVYHMISNISPSKYGGFQSMGVPRNHPFCLDVPL
jgi:hypothetical protein